jgi:hypothetical protein
MSTIKSEPKNSATEKRSQTGNTTAKTLQIALEIVREAKIKQASNKQAEAAKNK